MGGSIDLGTWKRRDHYLWFRKYERPFFSVTVDVDVTAAWNKSRKPGAPSFFLSSVFLMLRRRQRLSRRSACAFAPRGVWRHDRVAVGPTIMRPDETFGFVRLEPAATLSSNLPRRDRQRSRMRRLGKALDRRRRRSSDDIIFHSVLPWLRFTSFTNALPGKGDSIPRIVFGRCVREGRRMKMPVAVEVHHALVDGLDVARFFERFAGYLDRP